MTATATTPNIVERLRRDGRLPQALALLLGCGTVNPDKTTAINCIDYAHDDRHASAVVEPTNGRVTCKGCGRTWGLLALGVERAFGRSEAAVAKRLESFFYGPVRGPRGSAAARAASARTGAETPSWRRNPPPARLESEVSVPSPPGEVPGEGRTERPQGEFPFVPDALVESLGWKVRIERGRKVIRAPIVDARLEVCGIKVRGPRKQGGGHDAYLEPCRAGRREKGLLHAEGLADLGPGALVLVLAGETDLLAFLDAARREGVHVVALSPSNGERQSLRALAPAFRGLRVVFLYDADDAGRTGALDAVWDLRDTAEKAAALALPFTEEQAALGMKDVRDYLTAGGTATELVDLAKKALDGEGVVVEEKKKQQPSAGNHRTTAAPAPTWTPFPTDALPGVLRALVEEGAAAIGCDPAYIALTVLAVIAGVIGNTRTILLKKGWVEVCVLWTVIVGESGTAKSPAMDLALAALRRQDDEAQAENAKDRRLYKAARQRYEVELAAWKRDGGIGEPPEEPEYPKARRYIVVDATVEAIAKILSENARGAVLVRDELSGWIGSFDAYRGGRGGDTAFYLSAHGARPHVVDRKGDPPTIHVPRAALSITGGIQPGTLAECIGKQHAEDGLLARLLFAMPPRVIAKWTTAVVDDLTKAAYAKVIADLLALDLLLDEEGMPAPRALPLSEEAQNEWVAFHDRFCERQAGAVGNEASALSKLVAYAARFTLVHQLARDARADEIDAEAVRSGARLAEWFADEMVRVYAVLGETPEDTARRRLVEWISARGGRTTLRDLSRGPREYRDKEVAESALDALVATGRGAWEEKVAGEKGGRPTKVFVLTRTATEEVSDQDKEAPSRETSPGGDGTETSKSSLEGGGFRRQRGVLAPQERGSAAAAPIDLTRFEDGADAVTAPAAGQALEAV